MNLTQLIQDIKEKGILSVDCQLRGRTKPVLDFMAIIDDTEAFNPSRDYCEIAGEYYAESGGSVNPRNQEATK